MKIHVCEFFKPVTIFFLFVFIYFFLSFFIYFVVISFKQIIVFV